MNTSISLYIRLTSEILKLHLFSSITSHRLPYSPWPSGGFWRLEAIHITILPYGLSCAHARHSRRDISSAHSQAAAGCSIQSAANLSLAAQWLGSPPMRDIDEYGPLHGGVDRLHATCPVCQLCYTSDDTGKLQLRSGVVCWGCRLAIAEMNLWNTKSVRRWRNFLYNKEADLRTPQP